VTATYGGAVDGAAALMQLPQPATGREQPSGLSGPSRAFSFFQDVLETVEAAGTMEAAIGPIFVEVGKAVGKAARKQGRLYGKGCDRCGKKNSITRQ
jgi:hypothetical protein